MHLIDSSNSFSANIINVTNDLRCKPAHDGALDFAFVVHPRYLSDILLPYADQSELEEEVILENASRFNVHVLSAIEARFNGKILRGELISIPYLARDFRGKLKAVQQSLFDVLDYCTRRQTRIMGLGALLPSITHSGTMLAARSTSVGITTGHTYTAVVIADQIRKLEQLLGTSRIAIVGAAGSVGCATVACLGMDGKQRQLLLVDLPNRIKTLEANDCTLVTTNLSDIKNSAIVVCVTNSITTIIEPEHLAPGCVVIDDAQPENISIETIRQRPDIFVLKCLARIPSLRCPFDFNLFMPDEIDEKQNLVFTCLAETILLAADNHNGHFTVGAPTRDQLYKLTQLAKKFDVGIAPFHSFKEIGEVEKHLYFSDALSKN